MIFSTTKVALGCLGFEKPIGARWLDIMEDAKKLIKQKSYSPETPTCRLKNSGWKLEDGPFFLKWDLFRGHVGFLGCTKVYQSYSEKKKAQKKTFVTTSPFFFGGSTKVTKIEAHHFLSMVI